MRDGGCSPSNPANTGSGWTILNAGFALVLSRNRFITQMEYPPGSPIVSNICIPGTLAQPPAHRPGDKCYVVPATKNRKRVIGLSNEPNGPAAGWGLRAIPGRWHGDRARRPGSPSGAPFEGVGVKERGRTFVRPLSENKALRVFLVACADYNHPPSDTAPQTYAFTSHTNHCVSASR
jgi:hypothetical protein